MRRLVCGLVIVWSAAGAALCDFVTGLEGQVDTHPESVDVDPPVPALPSATQEYVLDGHHRWQLSELFMSRTVSLKCTKQIQVYSGRSADEVAELYNKRAASWCSSALTWDAWFHKGSKQCQITISPFGTTYIAVVPEDETLGFRPATMKCSVSEQSELSMQLLLSGAAGLFLFFAAPPLARSIAFRISVGGTLSVLLCTLIVALYCFRRVKPGNTLMSAAAGLTALGVSATGLAKMWFRFPDIPTLVTNRWFLAYVAVSFFIGAAVSYYFDSADSKIMDIISAALRLAGGSLVFYSLCQIWEVGAAAVLLLLLIAVRPGKAAHTERPVPSTPTAETTLTPASRQTGLQTNSQTPTTASHSWSPFRRRPNTPQTQPVQPTQPVEKPDMHMSADRVVQNGNGLASGFPEAHSHFSPKSGPATPREFVQQHPSASAPVHSPGSDSPLLAAGLVLNSATGRMIKIGGGTYQSLLERGFSMDREAGAMIPPAQSPDMYAADHTSPSRAGTHQRHSRRSGAGRSPLHGSTNSSATSPY